MRHWALRSRPGFGGAIVTWVVLTAFMLAPGSGAPKESLTIGLSSDASFINALIASDGQSY